MLNIDVSYEEVNVFSDNIYSVVREPNVRNSSNPLTKDMGNMKYESLDSWLDRTKDEEIGYRHHCGFYIYMSLTALIDRSSLSEFYFSAAFSCNDERKTPRPDKSIIQTSFDKGCLSFSLQTFPDHGLIPIFRLTDFGQDKYQSWLDSMGSSNGLQKINGFRDNLINGIN